MLGAASDFGCFPSTFHRERRHRSCIVFDTVSFVDSRISGLSRSRRTRSRGFYVVGVRAVTGVAWGVDQFVCRYEVGDGVIETL